MPRTRSRRRPAFSLTDRELDCLARLGRFRIANSEQLCRGLYPGRYGAKRLRKLYDAGMCQVLLTRSQEPSLYELTALGRRVVAAQRPGAELSSARSAPINLATLAHALLLVDLGLYAEALGKMRGAPLTRWMYTNGELPLAKLRLRPDAIAEFGTPRGPVLVALESDTGVEPAKVIASKMARYAGLAETGLVDAAWFGVPGEGRVAMVTGVVEDAGLGGWVRVFTREHLVERPVRGLPERRPAAALGPSVLNSQSASTDSAVISDS